MPDGIEFWSRRLREALKLGLKVGIVNFGNRSLETITDPMTLENHIRNMWGGGAERQRYLSLRWLIWK